MKIIRNHVISNEMIEHEKNQVGLYQKKINRLERKYQLSEMSRVDEMLEKYHP